MKGQLTILFENELNAAMFEGHRCFAGRWLLLLGTSLQIYKILSRIYLGCWFRMEGSYYKKPFNLLQN
jgi:hypothetical protein